MKTFVYEARSRRARRRAAANVERTRIQALPLAGFVLAGAVQAQEVPPKTADPAALEEVVVTATGTNISGVAPVGVQSVTISREQMEAIGATNVAEVVRTLPQIQNLGLDGAVRENGNANQTGNPTRGTALNLRGIGNAATLVLVDGHRLTPSGTAAAFLEAIQVPPAAIERIEVVPDGASAVYGSDAISGVVNYVLRKKFDGLELSGSYTANTYQADWSGSIVGGQAWESMGPLGRGNVILSYEHFHQNPVLRGQIPYYRQDLTPFGGLDNRVLNNNSTPGNPGNIRVGNQPQNTTIRSAGGNTYYGIPATTAGAVPTFAELRLNQPNLVDRSDYEDYLPRTTRNHVTLLLDQSLTEWLSAYYEGFYVKRATETRTFYSQNAATTVEISINPGTPYYIAGIPGTTAFPGGPPGPIAVQYNLLAHAPEGIRFLNDTPEETVSHTGGLRASLGGDWSADWYYTYGSVDDCGVCYFGFFVNNDAGNALTRAVNEGFINPYSTARLTDAQWQRISGDNIQKTQNRLYDTVLKFDGPLFSLPGGRVRTAIGFEYSEQVNRLQNGANRSRAFIQQPNPVGSPDIFVWDAQVDESRYQNAAFAELYVPLVGPNNAKPLVKSLSLSGAFRYDSYSDFGSTTNPKLGFTWELSNVFSLRGSWGTAFRAPALPDINNGLFSVAVAIPVTNNSGDPNIPVSFAIPGVGSFTNVLLRLGGNPTLGPEEGTTWTAGFDFTPGFLSGFRVSGTYYNIRYDSQIVGPYQGQYLNSAANRAIYASLITPIAPSASCVSGNAATAPAAILDALQNPAIANMPPLTGLSGRSFLYGIENLATANLCDVRAILDGRVINAAKTTQDGVDLQASYSFDAVQSLWSVGFSVSKILSNDQQIISGSPELNALDRINFPVSLRARTNASWSRGSWSTTLFGNYVGSYTNDTPIQGQVNARVPSWTTFDFNVGYRVPEGSGGPIFERVRVGLTAQNLFDRNVPIVLTGSTANDARNHDPLGRSWQLSFTKQF